VPLVRLLDFALLAFLVWWVWSQVIRGWRAAEAQRAAQAAAAAASAAASQAASQQSQGVMTLVPCARCGVHVPAGRTLPGRGGQVYCSDACRGLDGR
jgi:hypothetical protein